MQNASATCTPLGESQLKLFLGGCRELSHHSSVDELKSGVSPPALRMKSTFDPQKLNSTQKLKGFPPLFVIQRVVFSRSSGEMRTVQAPNGGFKSETFRTWREATQNVLSPASRRPDSSESANFSLSSLLSVSIPVSLFQNVLCFLHASQWEAHGGFTLHVYLLDCWLCSKSTCPIQLPFYCSVCATRQGCNRPVLQKK